MSEFIPFVGKLVVTHQYIAHPLKGASAGEEVPVLLLAVDRASTLPKEVMEKIVLEDKPNLSFSLWLEGTSKEEARDLFPVASTIEGEFEVRNEPEQDNPGYDGSENTYSRHRLIINKVTKYTLSRAGQGKKALVAAAAAAAAA